MIDEVYSSIEDTAATAGKDSFIHAQMPWRGYKKAGAQRAPAKINRIAYERG
jgi:hypothetical protein